MGIQPSNTLGVSNSFSGAVSAFTSSCTKVKYSSLVIGQFR